MACGSCGSGGCSTSGCGKSGGCATGGCNKLNTFDWLGNMLSPDQYESQNVYEIRFKNTRKGFYRNIHSLQLNLGDLVVVESERGYDIGTVSVGGMVARLQMKKKKYHRKEEDIPRIYRKANEADREMLEKVRERDAPTRARTREIIEMEKLDMKLSDVEYQGDNSKAIFYYIADHRVDFRKLIKILAREFHIRVEMKQIGLRHEAGLVGGIGSCGRELCCSTWLTEFKTVSTSAARYQNLSLNPMKISGLCGRLKCCLNFELDAYLDALEDFPKVESIETVKGKAILQKTDIFKRKMWFSYIGETTWYPMNLEEVSRILALNAKGEKPEVIKVEPATSSDGKGLEENVDFVDVVGQMKMPETQRSGRRNRKGRGQHPRNKHGGGQGRSTKNKQRNNNKGGQQNKQTKGAQNRQQGGSNQPNGSSNHKNRDQKGKNHPPRGKGQNKNRNRNRKFGKKGPKNSGPSNS